MAGQAPLDRSSHAMSLDDREVGLVSSESLAHHRLPEAEPAGEMQPVQWGARMEDHVHLQGVAVIGARPEQNRLPEVGHDRQMPRQIDAGDVGERSAR